MQSFCKLIVAYDLTPGSRAALFTAIELGARLRAEVDLVYVVGRMMRDRSERRASVESALAVVVEALSDVGCVVRGHVVEHANIVDGVAKEAASRKADLIVMGASRRRGISAWLAGSRADRLVRRGVGPVLTVRALAAPEN